MTDQETTIAELKRLLLDFSNARDWVQFHFPKDLALAMTIEVGEVLEHFRYKQHDEISAYLEDGTNRRDLGYELADVFWMLLRLSDVCGVDLARALEEKVALSEQKYPADKVRGLNHKYTYYQTGDKPV